MRDYRRLDVYQSAEQLVIDTCCRTATLLLEERYRLRAQMRAAAIPIASNISSRWH
jgi:four helix bundle protein